MRAKSAKHCCQPEPGVSVGSFLRSSICASSTPKRFFAKACRLDGTVVEEKLFAVKIPEKDVAS